MTTFSSILSSFLVVAITMELLQTHTVDGYVAKRGVTSSLFSQGMGAVLAVNGLQTTCEIGLMGSSAGFVAANCFTYGSGTVLDTSVKYGAILYDGSSNTDPQRYSIAFSNIHIHPSFNRTTLIYNMAIVEFSNGYNSTAKTYIAGDNNNIKHSSYAFRTLDPATSKWMTVNTAQQEDDPTDQCTQYGRLYKANPDWIACNNDSSDSVYNKTCSVPYSALYTQESNQVILVALYSHSIILGTDVCTDKRVNYYSYLDNYLGFAALALNRPINIYLDDKKTTTDNTTLNTGMMDPGTPVNITGKMSAGGDWYARQLGRDITESDTDSASPSPTSEPEPDPSQGLDDSGLTKTAKIVIGVVVPASVVLLVLLALLIYRSCSKMRQSITWNPNAEAMNLYEIANDLVADVSEVQPPPYDSESSAGSLNRIDTPAIVTTSNQKQ